MAGTNVSFNVDFIDFYRAETNVVNMYDYLILTNDCDVNNSDMLNDSIVSCKPDNTNQTSYVNHEGTDCAINVSLAHNAVTHNISTQSNDLVNQTEVNTIVTVCDLPLVNILQADPQDISVLSNDVPNTQEDPYKQLSKFCKKNSKRMIFSHMNINSLAPKFIEIQDILAKGFSDMFFISETKLDDSFPNAQFHVPSFSTHRIDRNAHGGGLLCYVKETIPH